MTPESSTAHHRPWVKISHWIITISFLLLAVTGFFILMVHPRLYWGEVGNDLTPALIELPISRNYKHGGYENQTAFFDNQNSPVSASRTYDIFNQNGWGRSLHFLSAWFLVATGLVYLIAGFFTGHFRKRLWPQGEERTLQSFWHDLSTHFKQQFRLPFGPEYNLLQKYAYLSVIFLMLPLVVVTGLTMSPAVTAAFPFLLSLFGGYQSARTLHFAASISLELFLIAHLVMIILSGFVPHMRAMTFGKRI